MSKKEIAKFTVRVLSAEDATWQGEVTANGVVFHFRSEMQLFRWLLKEFPDLVPEQEWEEDEPA